MPGDVHGLQFEEHWNQFREERSVRRTEGRYWSLKPGIQYSGVMHLQLVRKAALEACFAASK